MSTAQEQKCSLALVSHPTPPPALKTRSGAEADTKERQFRKPLPTQFRHDGFDYRQVSRRRESAIYEQRWSGCPKRSVCYEVIRIRRRAGFQINGRFVDPAEVYPKSEAWGVDGFTLTDKNAAFAKLRDLGGGWPITSLGGGKGSK